jgi:hypothetical protein
MSTTNAPEKRTGAQIFIVAGKVIFAHGNVGSDSSPDFNVYDPVTDTWSANPGTNAPDLTNISDYDRRLFVLGGKLHIVYRAHLTSSALSACDTDSDQRADEGSICDGDGNDNDQTNNPWTNSQNVNAMHYVAYDPTTDAWTSAVPFSRTLVPPRNGFYLAGFEKDSQSQLAIMGGQIEGSFLSSSGSLRVDKVTISSSGVLAPAGQFPDLPNGLNAWNPLDVVWFDEGASGFSILQKQLEESAYRVYTYSSSSNSWTTNSIPYSTNNKYLDLYSIRPNSIMKTGNQIALVGAQDNKLKIINLTNTNASSQFVASSFSSLPRFSPWGSTHAVSVTIPGQGIFIWGGKYNDYASKSSTTQTATDGAIVRTVYADQFK